MAHSTTTTTDDETPAERFSEEKLQQMTVDELTRQLRNCAAATNQTDAETRLSVKRRAAQLAQELVRRGENPRATGAMDSEN